MLHEAENKSNLENLLGKLESQFSNNKPLGPTKIMLLTLKHDIHPECETSQIPHFGAC